MAQQSGGSDDGSREPTAAREGRLTTMSDIPAITIVDDPGVQPNTADDGPSISGYRDLLSPCPPRSTTGTTVDRDSDHTSLDILPPSPTLSTRSLAQSAHSVHFATSTDLRFNNPNLVSVCGHARKPSSASTTTVPDDHTFSHELSDLGHVRSDSSTSTLPPEIKIKTQKGQKKQLGEERSAHRSELGEDNDLNPAPFLFTSYQLAHLLDQGRSLNTMACFKGTKELLRGLGTDGETGLRWEALSVNLGASAYQTIKGQQKREVEGSLPTHAIVAEEGQSKVAQTLGDVFNASVDERRRVYGTNVLPTKPSKSLSSLIWLALKDKDFGTPRPKGNPPVEWIQGVAIIVAIVIVVTVGALNDWQKEQHFKALNDRREERGVKVIRDGVECIIDVKEVVVGDIALLEPGEIVPCDGLFLGGHNVRCDESGATGESDALRKLSYEDCMEILERDGHEAVHASCYIVSGSKVLEGVGRYVVIAVGPRSVNGRIMMDNPVRTASQKGIAFVNILIISVTIVVVAVPEGLPLAVTLALAFATKRMAYEKLLVRVLGSCETMANTSVVCTDKTGTLTQNIMTVVAGSVGVHAKFVRCLQENSARHNADGKDIDDFDSLPNATTRKCHDFAIDQTSLSNFLSPALRDLFNQAIAINSAAFEHFNPNTGEVVFVGSKTESAILQFAKELGWKYLIQTDDAANIVQFIPFSSERKAKGVVVRLPTGKTRLYMTGASEILAKQCNKHVVVHSLPSVNGQDNRDRVETSGIGVHEEENISRTIIFYAKQTLRTIALCYRDFEHWPPPGMEHNEYDEVSFTDLAKDLTLIGIIAIEDPLRPGIRDAVEKCRHAGVTVKMCTGDNELTARSIATQCGIFRPGDIIMEGPVFRKLTQAERVRLVPRLQVLARSSPDDKEILVNTLKNIGEIVGVTGDGVNDGPALKQANVGFSMGIAGTEVAKEASDIILMDDNFSSIVKAIMWGRCINDAVRKFLQFQISTSITAVIITFISAVTSVEEASVLSAVQLLWINLIMDTFAALALATDPASESLLHRLPEKKAAPLFSTDMHKQIFIQSIYQITFILILHFLGLQILGLQLTGDRLTDKHAKLIVKTLVFNAFVFAQIFNSVNCRRLDRNFNIFEGILKNGYFLAIIFIETCVQTLIVFVAEDTFQVVRIGGREWGISLALGFFSIPLGALIRFFPNEPFIKSLTKLNLLGRPEVLPTTSPEGESWSSISAANILKKNIGVFQGIRGGRLRSSSSIVLNTRMNMKRSNSHTKLSIRINAGIGQRATLNTSSFTDTKASKASTPPQGGRPHLHSADTPHANSAAQRRFINTSSYSSTNYWSDGAA
ncbi:hypothetical protein H0H87_007657 [Tephrocybe sp. NHM501043]|nr:hypothetical protein H0H87_007657 [Tephrocybe sp. NHM501043]